MRTSKDVVELANQAIGHLGLSINDVEGCSPRRFRAILQYNRKLHNFVSKVSAAKRGEIWSLAITVDKKGVRINDDFRHTAITEMFTFGYISLNLHIQPKDILTELCSFVILAAAYDILITELDMSSEPGHAGANYPIKEAMRKFVMSHRISRKR